MLIYFAYISMRTSQGNSPFSASAPPTILFPLPPLTPHWQEVPRKKVIFYIQAE